MDQVQQTVYSPWTYTQLQELLAERCRPRQMTLSHQQMEWPEGVPVAQHRVPHKQLLLEMAALIKQHLYKVQQLHFDMFSDANCNDIRLAQHAICCSVHGSRTPHMLFAALFTVQGHHTCYLLQC